MRSGAAAGARPPERVACLLGRQLSAGVPVGRPRRIPHGILERIRHEHDAGHSLATIADGLNTDRVPTAQGGRRWYPATVRYLLTRECEPGNDGLALSAPGQKFACHQAASWS